MIRRSVVVAVAALLSIAPAIAAYPDHPVRIIVPYAAGGPADVTARLLANKLQEKFGQSFVVDNRSGAGGNIGTAAGAQAAADGYTLTIITPAQIINTTLFSKPGYGLKEFAPLALLTTAPALLLANPKLGVSSVAGIIAAAKAKPGAISFASQGTGVAPHLMMEMIKKAAGIDMVHVPYRGSAPALNDVIAGNVPLMMDSIVTGLPHVRSGALKGIAVSTAKRTLLAPDIPTVAESGIAGFEAFLWYGIVAPAQTPPDIVAQLAREIAAVMALSDIRERLVALGSEPADSNPSSFAAFIKAESEKWGEIVHSSGAKAD
jgi:tripartite-type tricarboxylate transporter receptor subunit TctC